MIKHMERIFLLLILTASNAYSSNTENCIRVGVSSGWGSDSLISIFNAEKGMQAFEINRFTPDALAKCDVLVVTQRASALPITRAVVILKKWVEGGKGIMFLHGSVGYKSHIPVFSDIGSGGKVLGPEKLKPVKAHPVTQGLKMGEFFMPSSGYNYVSIKTGDVGESLLESEKGVSALVAGNAGKGRVVLNGIGAGAAGDHFDVHMPTSPEEMTEFKKPEYEELQIMLNSIRWLGFAKFGQE